MDTKKFQMLIGLLGALSLACAVFLYYQIKEAGDMWPAVGEPGSLTHTITRLQGEIQTLQTEVAKIPPAEKQLVAVRVDYDMAARVLPKESSIDHLLAAISTKAQQSGISPSSVTPLISKPGAARAAKGTVVGNFDTWSFSLVIDGSYDQIAAFVNRMEEFESTDVARMASEKRFFEVREINITAAGNGVANLESETIGKPVRHACTLVMQTYRYAGE